MSVNIPEILRTARDVLVDVFRGIPAGILPWIFLGLVVLIIIGYFWGRRKH